MAQKIIVNGIEFVKVSRNKVEQIEESCRQYRSEYVFSSVKSVAGLLKNQIQRLFGQSLEYEVN